MKNTKTMILAALMIAFTCVATMIIKFPTPTFGYIHLGDSLVLLCGLLLGPGVGALAAGIGSMFADLFSGYGIWAPATLIIKALTAFIVGTLYHKASGLYSTKIARTTGLILSGIAAEAFMVLGYFLFEMFLAILAVDGAQAATVTAAAAASLTGVPFNIIQGVVGIAIAAALYPALSKIPQIRELGLSSGKSN